MTDTQSTGIRWGYTLHTLDTITRTAIRRNLAYYACDTSERYAAAWHAAVELLYTNATPPARHDLIRAAWYAADAHTLKTAEQRGIPRSRGDSYTGRTDMPRWHAYWETIARHTASPEEPTIERIALAQIWPQLTPGQQAALHALAAHGTYEAAAAGLGLSYHTFARRISTARQQFLALWWEGETPRRGWRDRRRSTPQTQLHSASAHIRKRARAQVAA